MANRDTVRNVKFNAHFNWDDERPQEGGITITGSCKALTKLTLEYKIYDASSTAEVHTDDDGTIWNIRRYETLIFR